MTSTFESDIDNIEMNQVA